MRNLPTSRQLLNLLGGVIIGIGIGVLGVWGWESFQAGSEYQFSYGLESGSTAPSFELADLEGRKYSLERLRGRPIMLNFWATWCEPCKLEMPLIEQYSQKMGDKMQFLGINLDESKEKVQAFIDENGVTFTMLMDPGAEVQRKYKIRGYPTSVFIDSQGLVSSVHVGVMAEDKLLRYLDEVGALP